MCDSRTKKLTHRPAKFPLRKHVNLEKGKKIGLFLFSPVKIWSTLLFLRLTFIFHKILDLVEFQAPRQLQKSNPDLPGKFFELIPGGCPGDVPSWNWLRHNYHSGLTSTQYNAFNFTSSIKSVLLLKSDHREVVVTNADIFIYHVARFLWTEWILTFMSSLDLSRSS